MYISIPSRSIWYAPFAIIILNIMLIKNIKFKENRNSISLFPLLLNFISSSETNVFL